MPEAVARAQGRLAPLRSDPLRNASHAVKVLVKFKLLEQQSMSRAALLAWMHGTPLMQRIHARFMAETPFETVFAQTLRGLAAVDALALDGETVHNRD
ncbi:hypothetical protein D3C81_1618110 [compost metagenome]